MLTVPANRSVMQFIAAWEHLVRLSSLLCICASEDVVPEQRVLVRLRSSLHRVLCSRYRASTAPVPQLQIHSWPDNLMGSRANTV